MRHRDALASELRARLAAFDRSGDRDAVLDPEALLAAAALLRQAMPVLPRQDGMFPVDREAAHRVAAFHASRHAALPDGHDGSLADGLYAVVSQLPPDGALAPPVGGGLPPPVAEAWNSEALVLFGAFEETERLDLLDAAVIMWRRISALVPQDHPRRPAYLSVLGAALLARFERRHILGDLEDAISAERAAAAALPDGSPARALCLAELGLCLEARFEFMGRPADLDEAVAAGRAAVAVMPAGDPGMLDCRGNLAFTLQVRFEQRGRLADIDETVGLLVAALTGASVDHPGRLGIAANLCGALLARHEYTGHPGDLDEAIAVGHDAVDAAPPDDLSRSVLLANLGSALRVRYDRLGALPDLTEAVAVGRAAVQAVPEGHPSRPVYASDLGLSLLTHFERAGSMPDLEEAIGAFRAAAGGVPQGDPARAGYLSNLGIALRERFNETGLRENLDESVASGQAAVDAAPAGHPSRGGYLTNVCLALRARSELTRDPADVDASIDVARAALAEVNEDRPDHAMLLLNLGLALSTRYRLGRDQRAAQGAREVLRQAARSPLALTPVRVEAARAWGELAGELEDWPDAVRGYQTAVELVSVAAWHGLDRADRIHVLTRSWGLAGDAAAASVRAGEPERAVELLEQARGVLAGQAIDARTDRRMLLDQAPGLAQRMDAVRVELDMLEIDHAGLPPAAPDGSAGVQAAEVTEQRIRRAAAHRAARRRALAREWDDLVARARGLPGFRDFLRARSFADLRCCAADGPVAIVNISRHGSHGLVVTQQALEVLPLDRLTFRAVIGRIQALQDALAAVPGSDEGFQHAHQVLADTLGWLWDTIASPLMDTVASPSGPPAERLPRLWWCPVGLAAFLPLHAAYSTDPATGTGAAVMDRVVSSYTPTLRALADARDRAASVRGTSGRMLAVAIPATMGMAALPQAEREAQAVAGAVPAATVLAGNLGTRDRVLAELSRHAFLHFAGHAEQDPDDVSSGALYTCDYRDRGPITIADLAALRLTDARLAFLSACRTALGATGVPDEALHLAGTLMLAGFTHVVAAQWRISDAFAPKVAKGFYARLIRADGYGQARVDPDRAARALHDAIQRLRGDRSPLLWVPYVHFGP
jgi:CHAT domain